MLTKSENKNNGIIILSLYKAQISRGGGGRIKFADRMQGVSGFFYRNNSFPRAKYFSSPLNLNLLFQKAERIISDI